MAVSKNQTQEKTEFWLNLQKYQYDFLKQEATLLMQNNNNYKNKDVKLFEVAIKNKTFKWKLVFVIYILDFWEGERFSSL